MDFSLTDEQKMLVETLKTMGEREKFKERAAENRGDCLLRSHFARVCAEVFVKMMFRAHTPWVVGPKRVAPSCVVSPGLQRLCRFSRLIEIGTQSAERTINESLA